MERLEGMAIKERTPIRIQITTTPEISSKEMIWYKGKNREIRPTATDRRPFEVFSEEPLADDRMVIHTHLIGPTEELIRKGRGSKREMPESLPSCGDLTLFLDRTRNTSIRASVIISIDKSGAITGSTYMRATKRFVELAKTTEMFCDDGRRLRLRSNKDKFSYASYLAEQGVYWGQTYTKIMTAIKLFSDAGLQIRVCPASGYEFDGMKFVKKQVY